MTVARFLFVWIKFYLVLTDKYKYLLTNLSFCFVERLSVMFPFKLFLFIVVDVHSSFENKSAIIFSNLGFLFFRFSVAVTTWRDSGHPKMQQAVSDEGSAFEQQPSVRSYDDLFPALPESAPVMQSNNSSIGQWNSKMRVGSTRITQVFNVPFEERKKDHSKKFGEGESMQTCLQIMNITGAHIEISSCKDQSLTFLISGKPNEVFEARRKILTHFQTQVRPNHNNAFY